MIVRAVVVLALSSSVALAQIDTENRNNTRSGADPLPLPVGSSLANLAEFTFPSHDLDFYSVELSAGEVLMGMVTPMGNVNPGEPLTSRFTSPDTRVGAFQGTRLLSVSDDDDATQSPRGSRLGSLFRLRAESTDTYHLGITGGADDGFEGFANRGFGGYLLTVGRIAPSGADSEFVPGGRFPDSPGNDVLAGADPIRLTSSAIAVGALDDSGGDVDFFRLDLVQGQVLTAMTAPLESLSNGFSTPDTMLGLFSGDGLELLRNDDAGDRSASGSSDSPSGGIFGSAMRAIIPRDGTYYLGVTGYGDDQFHGVHGESGRYGLLVGVVPAIHNPEPSGLNLLAGGGFMLWPLRRKAQWRRLY